MKESRRYLGLLLRQTTAVALGDYPDIHHIRKARGTRGRGRAVDDTRDSRHGRTTLEECHGEPCSEHAQADATHASQNEQFLNALIRYSSSDISREVLACLRNRSRHDSRRAKDGDDPSGESHYRYRFLIERELLEYRYYILNR